MITVSSLIKTLLVILKQDFSPVLIDAMRLKGTANLIHQEEMMDIGIQTEIFPSRTLWAMAGGANHANGSHIEVAGMLRLKAACELMDVCPDLIILESI